MNFLVDDIIKWLVKVYLAAPGLDPRPPEDEWAQACVSYWLSNVTPFAIGLKHKAFEASRSGAYFNIHVPKIWPNTDSGRGHRLCRAIYLSGFLSHCPWSACVSVHAATRSFPELP
jgi:hypothetical protein